MAGIREDVEKRFFEFLGEVVDKIGTERVQQVLEGAINGAASTKKVVDKNVESLLALANIPSRRDFERMRNKLEALQGSVITLTRTVEDLREKLAEAAPNGASNHATSHAAPSPSRPAAATAKPKRASISPAKRSASTGPKRAK
jgi:hypothetical protein